MMINTENKSLEKNQIAVLLAAITYSSNPTGEMQSLLPDWHIVWNGLETVDGNYAFIATDTSQTNYVLAIRGSLPPQGIFSDWYSFANWIIEDLDVIKQTQWPYASTEKPLIGQGTFTAFNNVLTMQDQFGSGKSIDDYLFDYAVTANKSLSIVGHSLGGNIANVYASYFSSTVQQQGYNFDGLSLYTFAAPASGNEDFASDLDNKITDAWHYANNNDIVPKFPVSSAILALAFLFIPSPSAGEITFTYKGLTISLREGLVILSGIFELGAYQQESNNYIPFTNPLDANYANNTMQDWFSQAAAQHAMNVYANYLDVTLTAKLDKESSIL